MARKDLKRENEILLEALRKISREARSTYAARVARGALSQVAMLRVEGDLGESKPA